MVTAPGLVAFACVNFPFSLAQMLLLHCPCVAGQEKAWAALLYVKTGRMFYEKLIFFSLILTSSNIIHSTLKLQFLSSSIY